MTTNNLKNGGKVLRCADCGETAPVPEGSDIPKGWVDFINLGEKKSKTATVYHVCEQCVEQNTGTGQSVYNK